MPRRCHELHSSRAQRQPRAGDAACGLYPQLSRPADARHPRRADQGRPAPQRYAIRRDRRAGLRLALCPARGSAQLSRRSHQPQRGDRRQPCGVERLHRAVRDRDRVRPVNGLPPRRRHRRGRGSGAVLCPDRGLFPAPSPCPRARHLLARGPARTWARDLARRLSRDLAELARGVFRDGRDRAGAGTVLPLGRQGQAACGHVARAPVRRLRHCRAAPGVLAAGVRGVVQLARRLWPGRLGAVGDDAQLRARSHPYRLVRRLAATDRRHQWRAARRLSRRPLRTRGPARLRLAARRRLGDHRPAVRRRPADRRLATGVVAAADPQRAQHLVDRADGDRGPASGSGADARDRVGMLPADQQSHRAGGRTAADRGAVGRVQGAAWQ